MTTPTEVTPDAPTEVTPDALPDDLRSRAREAADAPGFDQLPGAQQESAALVRRADPLEGMQEIEREEDLELVREILERATAVIRRFEEIMRPVIQLQHRAHRASTSALRELVEPPEALKIRCAGMIGRYQRRLEVNAERERRRLEAEARERAEAEAERTAETLLDNGRDEEALAVLEQEPAPVVPAAPAPPKPKGLATYDVWSHAMQDRPAASLGRWSEAIAAASTDERGLAIGLAELFGVEPAYLVVDGKAVGAQVRALKSADRVRSLVGPGVVVQRETKARSTGRRS